MTRESAAWTRTSALLGAGVLYLIGTSQRFVWDISEVCQANGESFDPATRSSDALFPISQRCNANYDLVPAFINPTIVALVAVAIIASIVTWMTAPAVPEPTDATPNESRQK